MPVSGGTVKQSANSYQPTASVTYSQSMLLIPYTLYLIPLCYGKRYKVYGIGFLPLPTIITYLSLYSIKNENSLDLHIISALVAGPGSLQVQ